MFHNRPAVNVEGGDQDVLDMVLDGVGGVLRAQPQLFRLDEG